MSRNICLFSGVVEIVEKVDGNVPTAQVAQRLRGRVISDTLHGVEWPITISNYSTLMSQESFTAGGRFYLSLAAAAVTVDDEGNPGLQLGVWEWREVGVADWVPDAVVVASATIIEDHVLADSPNVEVLTCCTASYGARERRGVAQFEFDVVVDRASTPRLLNVQLGRRVIDPVFMALGLQV